MTSIKGYLAVCGTASVYFAMGLYFSSGNTAVYLTSYLRHHTDTQAQLSDSIWFLAAVGLSALILPFGGMLDSIIGLRAVCLLGGILQRFDFPNFIIFTYSLIDCILYHAYFDIQELTFSETLDYLLFDII